MAKKALQSPRGKRRSGDPDDDPLFREIQALNKNRPVPVPIDGPSVVDIEEIEHSGRPVQIGTTHCPTCGGSARLMVDGADLKRITKARRDALLKSQARPKKGPGGKFYLADDGRATAPYLDCPDCRKPEGKLGELHIWLRSNDQRANLAQDPALETIRSELIERFGGYDAKALDRFVDHLCQVRKWTRDQAWVRRRDVVAQMIRDEQIGRQVARAGHEGRELKDDTENDIEKKSRNPWRPLNGEAKACIRLFLAAIKSDPTTTMKSVVEGYVDENDGSVSGIMKRLNHNSAEWKPAAKKARKSDKKTTRSSMSRR